MRDELILYRMVMTAKAEDINNKEKFRVTYRIVVTVIRL